MANRYWVGGSANWDNTAGSKWALTSGGAGGQAVPTINDDVFFDAASGSVTVTIPTQNVALCSSITTTGFTGTLSFASATNMLTIGGSTGGALTFAASMTLTVGAATSFLWSSTTDNGGAGWGITTAGKVMPGMVFSGTAGRWKLLDAVTATGNRVTVAVGHLDTNNQAIDCLDIRLSGSGVRRLTLGSSAITVRAGSGINAWDANSVTNLTIDANTAIVTVTGASIFHGGSANWGGLSVVANATGAVTINGACTVANITRSAPTGQINTLLIVSNLVVTGTLTLTSFSASQRLLCRSNAIGTPVTITAAVVALTNVDFTDIVGAGAASPFTGTLLGDAGGNSNVTFAASVTQTHTASVGGNWSDATKWTSRVPLPQDDVLVDANTTGTITADMARLGRNVTFTGFGGTASFSSLANTVYGSLTLASGMTVSGTQTLSLAGRGSHTLTSAGKTFTQAVSAIPVSGTYTMVDAFATALNFTHNSGTLVTGSFAHMCLNFSVGALTTLVSGTTVFTLASISSATVFSVAATSIVDFSANTIIIANASANTRTFAGGGHTYGTLRYTVAGSTGALVITGSNTFATLQFSDVTNARSLRFTAGTTTTVATAAGWQVTGTAGKLMTVESLTAATHSLALTTQGVVSTDYLTLVDSVGLPNSQWFAGANSVNGGGNSGWNFQVPGTPQPHQFMALMA